jgi:hypothetical protein
MVARHSVKLFVARKSRAGGVAGCLPAREEQTNEGGA